MAHSNVRLWIHAVFAIKYREAQILPSIEPEVHRLLFDQLVATGCFVDCMNGIPDHIHLLFRLNPKRSVAEVIGTIKGGSSHSINQSDLLPTKFAWQNGYSAFSVSESKIPIVRRYIERQKVHHLGEDFAQELAWLERLHGILPDGSPPDSQG